MITMEAAPPSTAGPKHPTGPKIPPLSPFDRAGIGRCCPLSVAHELSGLGSTRVVRFYALCRSRGNEPDDVATGPQDEEVSGCIEPMGEEGFVGDGGWRASGDVGATIPPLSGSLRGGRGVGGGRQEGGARAG